MVTIKLLGRSRWRLVDGQKQVQELGLADFASCRIEGRGIPDIGFFSFFKGPFSICRFESLSCGYRVQGVGFRNLRILPLAG